MTAPPRQLPRAGRLHRGYHRKQVDAFLGDVELGLAGALPLVGAAEIRRAGFELVRGGYDTVAVDAALDALEERVLVAQSAGTRRRGPVDLDAERKHLRAELATPYATRFPRAGRLHRGYDVADVDRFIDRVAGALSEDGAAVTLRLEDVRSALFLRRWGGYREDAVDETLDRVVELLLLQRA